MLPLNLVSLTWFKVLINQSNWIGFHFSITFQVPESAVTAMSLFFFFDRLNQVYCVRVWMGVRGRSRLYQFFFRQDRGKSNNSRKRDYSRHDYFSRKYDTIGSNIQVTFKVFGKTRKRQHLEGISMQLLFLLVQRLNCSFLLTSCYCSDKVKGIPLPHQGD